MDNNIRVRYSKTGKSGYISHLDLMTLMQRAFIRSGVSLKYSEGFNPHPHISVALPLPVGAESMCELLDVALQGGSIPDTINNFMPEGVDVLKTYRPWRGFKDIKWVDAQFTICSDDIPPLEVNGILEELFAAKSCIIKKKTKRGITEIDVAPHIRDVSVSSTPDSSLAMVKAKISAQNPTIGYKDIVQVINNFNEDNHKSFINFSNVLMKRIEIYDTNMILFK